ncbi:MAG TPA: endonuclease III domain-containing protein [Clostridiales bacterium]|nr:endonuclease III domain-containing protein [Clostridiales bacterium]
MDTQSSRLMTIYRKLYYRYGPQHWWPGDTPFEVMVGAILTQNTSWNNVEKAITNLKPYLKPQVLYNMEDKKLAQLIRPSGFFNIKTKRLKNFLKWFKKKDFSLETLKALDAYDIRKELLGIKGIGRETADSIILYALNIPIFVIDAYTKRMFNRLGFSLPDSYDDIQRFFQANLPKEVQLYNEYHALIVRHCKECCKKRPLCDVCCLKADCQKNEMP